MILEKVMAMHLKFINIKELASGFKQSSKFIGEF